MTSDFVVLLVICAVSKYFYECTFFPFLLQVYRAQFERTIPESKMQEPYTKKLVGLISGLLAMSVILFAFLRKYSKYIGLCYLICKKGT